MKKTTLLLSLFFVTLALFTACDKEEDTNTTNATCTDGIQNGNETGIDCGGSCSPCSTTATCTDGIQNGTETGVDCGGSCSPCTVAPTCTDGIQNGTETGVDCGGSCPPCTANPTCNDGIQNGAETGVDCGGSCPNACPTCIDGIQNGDETGVDCGGSCDACFNCGSSYLKDIDNNSYSTVQIGNQCWMKENLKVTRFKDGTAIPIVHDPIDWRDLVNPPLPGYSWYDGLSANALTYGNLYNWIAVGDSRGICPDGWHVPTSAEYTTLVDFLGGSNVAGGKMKSTSGLWTGPNAGATNSSGFTALPGGDRNTYVDPPVYAKKGETANFWTASGTAGGGASYIFVQTNFAATVINGGTITNVGKSCRCVKD